MTSKAIYASAFDIGGPGRKKNTMDQLVVIRTNCTRYVKVKALPQGKNSFL